MVYTPRPHSSDTETVIIPHTCARDKAIIFFCRLSVVITKITTSRLLRIYVCCNYHELVGIGKKLASVRFELANMAH